MKKVLIFDFDGTLADTIWAIRAAVNKTMRHYSFPERSYDEVKAAIGGGVRVLAERVLPPGNYDEDFIEKFIRYYNKQYELTVSMTDRCYPGMHEAVTELVSRGYRLAILSNKPDRFIRELTDNIFTRGEISFAAGQDSLPVKPDPTAPLMIAKKLGATPDECAFIGDSDIDVMTGKNAGMMTVGCTWGYRGEEVLRETGADIIIQNPGELLEIFK